MIRKVWWATAAVLESPIVILLSFIVAIAAVTISYQTRSETAERQAAEANARAAAIEAHSESLRLAFCDLVQPYAAIAQPTTAGGQQLARSFSGVAARLGCTPDPADGR